MPSYPTRVLCEFADTHKAPWKRRGLPESLVLFTGHTLPPEDNAINGAIVPLVGRGPESLFRTRRSSCGQLWVFCVRARVRPKLPHGGHPWWGRSGGRGEPSCERRPSTASRHAGLYSLVLIAGGTVVDAGCVAQSCGRMGRPLSPPPR